MLQLIGLLVISWLLTWVVFQKHDLTFLGLTPTKERLKYAVILFLLSAFFAATTFLLRIYFAKESYTLTKLLTVKSVLIQIWYQCRTVMTEELMCRGALLYILIKKFGKRKAILITSLLFAVLHWMNSGVWGNPTQMGFVFAFTFTMGLLLAYSYSKTFSLLIPFAIHFGWNLTQNYIFPDSIVGQHIFTVSQPPPVVTVSYFAFGVMIFFPKTMVILVNYFIIKRYKQVTVP